MARLLHQLINFTRKLRWSRRSISLHTSCTFGPNVDLRCGIADSFPGRIIIGPTCELSQGSILHAYGGHITLEHNVFLGPYVVIYGHGGVTIGADSLISMHCRILSSNHTVPGPHEKIRALPDLRKPTRIGADVWLGAGVTVLGGVTIGDGCVVGAGAVVTKDLPPFSIAYGVPAKITGSRNT